MCVFIKTRQQPVRAWGEKLTPSVAIRTHIATANKKARTFRSESHTCNIVMYYSIEVVRNNTGVLGAGRYVIFI